jgi:hypothetical protein
MKNIYNIGDYVKYDDSNCIFYGKIINIYVDTLNGTETLIVFHVLDNKTNFPSEIHIPCNSKYLFLEKIKQLEIELLYKLYLLKSS